MESVGGVASYWNPKLAAPVLPARSVQVPPTEAPPLSGPEYEPDVQPAIPAVASVPVKATLSAWLYQPFASAGRLGAAATAGGVLSILNV